MAEGGEEYCLLATVAAEAYEEMALNFQKRMGRPLYAVGYIVPIEADAEPLVYEKGGKRVELSLAKFNHFGDVPL